MWRFINKLNAALIRIQRLGIPMYFLVAVNLFSVFYIVSSLGDYKTDAVFLNKIRTESSQLDLKYNRQTEPEPTMASGFIFYDLTLPAWARGFRMPLLGVKIPQREDSLPGAVRSYRNGRHEGVDIFCPYGTPVLAAKNGYVLTVSADYHELSKPFRDRLLDISGKLVSTPAEVTDILHGRRIILDHGYMDGRWVITVYSHLSEVELNLTPGTLVRQGSVIGYVGNSGTSDAGTIKGSHLHFEIRVNNHYLGEGMSRKEAGKLYTVVMNGGES